MLPEDKKMVWVLAAAIIAAAIIVSVALNESLMRNAGGPELSHSPAVTTEGAVSGALGGVGGTGSAGVMSDQQTRKKYADRTIQFDETCQARPNAPVYKSGQFILLDNRAEASRVISFGGHQYTIAGYGFAVVALPKITSDKTFTIDCDFNQNVSTVTVQN